jgi:hypothetical protein
MTFWNIGDEECNDPDFLANPAAAGLYYLAGSWCMRQIFNRRGDTAIPSDWFVPEHFVAGIANGKRHAAYLVRVGKWKKVAAGYRYLVIQPGNTPEAVRNKRAADRDKPARKRPSKTRCPINETPA